MISSVSVSQVMPWFVEKNYRVGSFTDITLQSQWAEMTYGMGNILRKKNDGTPDDTSRMSEFSICAYLPIKKWMIGKRLFDIKGALLVPAVSIGYGQRGVKGENYGMLKGSVGTSIQLPYFGIDFRLNASYHLRNNIAGVKSFSLYPQIGLKFDGLWSLLDAERINVGTNSGVETVNKIRTISSTTTKSSRGTYSAVYGFGTETTTTTYTVSEVWQEQVPYSITRFSTDVGPFSAFGPHYTFKNVPYAGTTSMLGLGYYIRKGLFSIDAVVDAGNMGFASSPETFLDLENPDPKNNNKVSKTDFSNTGYYKSSRAYVRGGFDLWEILYLTLSKHPVTLGPNHTKFTRLICGMGYGYATFSKPYFDNNNGLDIANARFDANPAQFTSSRNHAKFAQDSRMISFYISLEAGSISFTIEKQRYKYAALANVNNLTIAYMFPYNRIKIKRNAIKAFKQYVKNQEAKS